jgi:hypothetical protein
MSRRSRARFVSFCAVSIGFVVAPRLALAQDSVPRLDDKEAAIEAALDQPTSFDFDGKTLVDVGEFLEQKHQLQIQFEIHAMALTGVEFTLHVHDIKLRSALDLLLRDLELTYVVRDEVLLITTNSEAEQMLTTRVYPVANLLAPRDDGVLITFGTNFGELVELITSSINPESWDELGGLGTIKEHSKSPSLVVSQTYAVHREVAALLASLRAVGHAQSERDPNEAPRAAIEDGQMRLKVYQLPRIQLVAGLPRPAAPAHPATATSDPATPATAPATSAPGSAAAAPDPPAGAPAAAGAATAQLEFVVRSQREQQRELLKMIESVIGPNTWTDSGGQGGIWIVNDSLVVRQTGDVHRQIGCLLEAISITRQQRPGVGGGMGGGMGGFF